MILDHFDVLILKKKFTKINIISIYFQVKNTLKNNNYYNTKRLIVYCEIYFS